jgi:DNA-binding CsgD family transcriptional regulator
MLAAVGGGRATTIGREPELALLLDFLDRRDGARALVFLGGPGIGKTTLWEAGIAAGRESGFRVLPARASSADARLAFAALIDLLDEVELGELDALPAPQRRALEIAVLRADPTGPPPELRAIALGLLNVLRGLAARRPLLLAIDDAQWLDSHSLDVLTFVAPRLETPNVRFLLSRRPGGASPLERAIGPPLERVSVGPLSLGAIRGLLHDRLGLSLSRSLLRRLVDSTMGNPLFALEVGRLRVEHGLPAAGDELPVPDAVEDLLGMRVGRLATPVRRALLAVALAPDLTVSQLSAIVDTSNVDEAADAGVVVVDGNRVRAAHPLLAAAAAKQSPVRERRELHLVLADVVGDDELRARHLALAARNPDEPLAELVAAAASGAAARGAVREAAVLGEHALRLTAEDSAGRSDRVLALANYLGVAGERHRLTDLLTCELEELPPGDARVRACLLLPGGAVRSNDEIRAFLERALVESEGLPEARAAVLANMSTNEVVIRVERIADAEAWAEEALATVRHRGPEMERWALYTLAWARSLRGRSIEDLRSRFAAVSGDASYILGSPERIAAQQLVWHGRLDEARVVLSSLLSLADNRGEPVSYALARLHLCELELRAGAWEEAARLLDAWAEPSEREMLAWPMYERCRALLAAGRGLVDEAERWAAEAIARADETGVGWDRLEASRALGTAALLGHDPRRAAESLGSVWAHTERVGVEEPGVFPVAPELVEALVELGEVSKARAVSARLRELAERQAHPWGLAAAKRCDGVIGLAGRAPAGTVELLEQAVDDYAGLGLRFDRARTLLLLGRGRRRRKKWAAARAALEQAVAAFDELGSSGWAEEAGSELARVGARRAVPAGELTPAETRVAALAAQGLANKEIARALFVSVHTVEVHLSHVYAKLGVHSRTQLARAQAPLSVARKH